MRPALLVTQFLQRLRNDADVRLRRFPVTEDLLGFLVGDGAGDDDVFALLPVDRGRDPVRGGELQGVDHAQDLVEVATCGHGIDENELELLVRPDDEDVAHGLVVSRCARLRVARDSRGSMPYSLETWKSA